MLTGLMTTSMALGMMARRLLRAIGMEQIGAERSPPDYSLIPPGHIICVTSIEVYGLQTRRADIGRLTNEYQEDKIRLCYSF